MKFLSLLLSLGLGLSHSVFAADALPASEQSDHVAEVYRDMIVVQRKAKNKAGSILFSIFDASEFSDGPDYINGVNISLGYAFSDSFEVYANAVPFFFLQDRPVKKSVASLTLDDGQKAALLSPTPKLQYGLDLYWLPAYGKDSYGPHTIIRSDTFLKLSVNTVQFEVGQGMRETLGIGKTLFLSPYFNPRFCASIGLHETIINNQKTNSEFGIIELGAVWYL